MEKSYVLTLQMQREKRDEEKQRLASSSRAFFREMSVKEKELYPLTAKRRDEQI